MVLSLSNSLLFKSVVTWSKFHLCLYLSTEWSSLRPLPICDHRVAHTLRIHISSSSSKEPKRCVWVSFWRNLWDSTQNLICHVYVLNNQNRRLNQSKSCTEICLWFIQQRKHWTGNGTSSRKNLMYLFLCGLPALMLMRWTKYSKHV